MGLERADEFVKYEKGLKDNKNKSGFGSEHINKHLDKSRGGWVSKEELLSIGEMMRNAQEHTISGEKSVYTYFDKDGVRFRVIVGSKNNGKERVVTFYSNRKAI
ncbi:MAG: hypothetical protein ACTTJS_01200 [Wolinella sp.]